MVILSTLPLMLSAVLLVFAVAFLAPAVVRRTGRASGWVLGLLPLALFGYFLTHLPAIQSGETVRTAVSWVPQLGVELAFVLDGLSLLFALLITGLGAAVVVYAGRYLEGHRDLGRFFLSLLAFMGAMLGLVLSDDLILMFVFWELTSITSYLLIGFKHEKEDSRASALQALLVTGGGGLALLAGILLIGVASGTTSISELLAGGDALTQHALYLPIFVLVALGAFTKSAQVPFHFWLPNAMAAPTPVSAYLHSATMVKAGVYLLARLDPVLGGTPAWIWTLALAGGATMLVGAVAAVRHTDLKKVLAYSTITALGTLVVLIGLSYDASLKAAVVFLIVHSLYKSVLFLVAGAVDHEAGTRDVMLLGGLRRKMPYSFGAAVLAGLSIAGLPPLFGFVGKELAYKAKLGVEGLGWVLPSVAVVANALTVVAAAILVLRPFMGASRSPKPAHEAPLAMWIGPVTVGVASLLFGVVPGLLAGLVAPAVDVVHGGPAEIKLALWYGVNTALYLSIATVVLGAIGVWKMDALRSALARLDRWTRMGPQTAYRVALQTLPRVAAWQTRFFEGGSLRTYLAATIGTVVLLAGGTFLWKGVELPVPSGWDVTVIEGAIAALILGAALVVTRAQSRLVAVTALGAVGIGVALVFVMASAPDLAMTQFLVEILIVVIVLLVMQHLPVSSPPRERRRTKVRNAAIALSTGGLVTTLILAVTRVPLDLTVPQFFADQALPGGFGRNVVNVILVDFRALDTLGEIAVIGIAALGAFVLIKFGGSARASAPPLRPSVVLQTGTRLMMTLLVLAALFLLWRGHNEPGGGFIGGLVAAAAFVLYTIAFRQEETERMLRVAPRTLMGTGLALAVASGAFAVVAGQPFMTGMWTGIETGGGLLKLGTPLLFDVGVFLVVVGFTLTFALALERISTATSTAQVVNGERPDAGAVSVAEAPSAATPPVTVTEGPADAAATEPAEK